MNNQPHLGQNGLVCGSKHNLCVGDYVIYVSSNGLFVSRRVTSVVSDNELTVESNCLLASNSNAEWKYVYIYSQATPGSLQLNEVNMISYVKTSTESNEVLDMLGLGGRKLYLQNNNFMNKPGSFYNESLLGNARAVEYCTSALSHNSSKEVPHNIDPSTVLEIELKPQPAPEVQVLAGFPLNGGLATETGRRPMIAVYQRGIAGKSTQVLYWGYYMRHTPESTTNYTQAINI
jgi:hypothetical protein